MKLGLLTEIRYRDSGEELEKNVMEVTFTVGGEEYVQRIPNEGWTYDVPALQFLAYVGVKPSDFEDGVYEASQEIAVVWNDDAERYFIEDQAFMEGVEKLSDVPWFNKHLEASAAAAANS